MMLQYERTLCLIVMLQYERTLCLIMMLQYEQTLCVIMMRQYEPAFSVCLTSYWNPFTIHNAIREVFYLSLANGYNARICNLMYICWHM